MKVQLQLPADHPVVGYLLAMGIPVRDRAPELRRLLAIAVGAVAQGTVSVPRTTSAPNAVAHVSREDTGDQVRPVEQAPPPAQPRQRKASIAAAVKMLS